MSKKATATDMIEFNPFLGGGDPAEGIDLEIGDTGDTVLEEATTDETEEAPQTEEQPKEQEQSESEPEQPEDDEPAAAEDAAPDTPTAAAEDEDARIPKSRLEREAEKRRELEAANNRLQAQMRELQQRLESNKQPDAPKIELDEATTGRAQELFQAIGDENLDEASKIFQEIIRSTAETAARSAVQDIDGKIEQGASRHTTKLTVGQTIEELKATYPVLDDNADEYDSERVEETLVFQDMFINKGFDPATALRKAAEKVMGYSQPAQPQQAGSAPVPPPKKASPKKVAEAANAQPPRTDGTSTKAAESDTPSIASMSLEDFEKLTASELAKIRGDFL